MKKKNNLDRRDFIKTALAGGITLASASILNSCGVKNQNSWENVVISEDDIDSSKMEYRINPNTNDKVSLLGYGCMRLPSIQKSETEEEIDQETWNELVDIAIEHGINYFDTSPRYEGGLSEKATGIALSRHSRDKYFIATKLSNFDDASQTREASIEMYKKSFTELQVDYIDYYLLHAVGLGGMERFSKRYLDNNIIDYLVEEREAGRIRNLGWSFHGDVEVFDYLLAMDVQWDFIQIQMNFVDWKYASGWNVKAEYLYEQLTQRNIPAVVMEPILGGRLAKIPNFLTGLLKQQKPEASIGSWAFRYAGTPSNILTVLSGMTYKEHLVENLHTYSPLEPINDKENTLLDNVAKAFLEYPLISCTACEYCMPCPYGIDIPGVFSHYNKCINEGNFPKSTLDENYTKNRKAFLVGYDRSVPKLRQASHCIGCDICAPKCPQYIQISTEMKKINDYVEHLKQEIDYETT